jgi:lincosamide nucleotidyltransferase A/C/D/E
MTADFEAFVRRAEADPDVVGIVLMGSRGYEAYVGEDSDHDPMVIVKRDPESWRTRHGSSVEAWPMTLERFRSHGLPGDVDAWNRPAFLGVRVVLDRLDGEIGQLVARKRTHEPEEARSLASYNLDGYLNSLYRSLRNLEAGRDLEGRLDALESLGPLMTAIFAFEGRVRPFNKWLRHELGQRPLAFGDLAGLIDCLASDPSIENQRRAFRRVETAARFFGHGEVVDSWEPDVDWLRGRPRVAPETTAADVEAFLDVMDGLGIRPWLDGGWAVDACLGEQSRRHADLDIVIEQRDLATAVEALTSRGYEPVLRDDTRPENFVLGDDAGHEVDFHVIVLDATGRGAYGPAEIGHEYPAAALAGSGTINGRTVACISPEWLVRWHTGYPLAAKDFADVAALCARFGIDVPDEYVHPETADPAVADIVRP